MEPSKTLIRSGELEERPQGSAPEEAILAAVLSAALLAYRRRLVGPEEETELAESGRQWQAVARWQQLAPAIQHQAQRQR